MVGDMTSKFDSGSDLRCSFCGKDAREVRKLIAGLRVHICDECVALCNEIIDEDGSAPAPAPVLEPHHLPPKKIREYLDQYLVGQELAKKTLAVAVYNHYKRIHDETTDDVELSKGNVLMLGPTGTGKTFMAQTLAKLLDVPFTIVDATCLTEAGYVGEDVENIIKNLWIAAGKDPEKAARGIVCIHEIAKIARRGEAHSMTRDVGGEGVQQALLKMVESEIVNIPPEGNRNRPQQDFIQVDSTNILFIACGAFDQLPSIIEQRLGEHRLGFGNGARSASAKRSERTAELLRQVRPEDLVKFGLIPEFIGRFPIVVPFAPLPPEALVEILWKPKNALVRQYTRLCELEQGKRSFSDEALRAVAEEAMRRNSGARGLRAILEDIMLDIMYDMPSLADLDEVVIQRETVTSRAQPKLIQIKKTA